MAKGFTLVIQMQAAAVDAEKVSQFDFLILVQKQAQIIMKACFFSS